MGRKRKELRVWKRSDGYYLYALGVWPSGKRKSTGTKDMREAYRIAEKALAEEKAGRPDALKVGDILENAYDWSRCLHVKRLRDEGKVISQQHAENMQRLIKRVVMPDKIIAHPVQTLKRYELLELRDRILTRTTVDQTNRAIIALHAIFEEWKQQQRIESNPFEGIGKLAKEEKEVGTFNQEELHALFETMPGVWAHHLAYSAFLLAATTGMRRGEILALTWSQVDFDTNEIRVDRAMKGNGDVGRPKWEKVRATFLPSRTAEALKALREQSIYVMPGSLVFANRDGEMYSGGFWAHHFREAMIKAGFMSRDDGGKIHNPRNLRPHSLRHSVATLLRAGGVDATAIRASMGWSNENTQDGYTHWEVRHFEDQRKAVDSIYG